MSIKNIKLRILIAGFTIATASMVTLFQVANPEGYLRTSAALFPSSYIEYRLGFPSGYGLPETVKFLEDRIGNKPAFITMALHTGNPESGVLVSFMKRKNVLVSYMESGTIRDIDKYDCLVSDIPVYFVSREDDTAGLKRFMDRIYYRKNPVSGFGTGIYILKQSCTGKTLHLNWYKT